MLVLHALPGSQVMPSTVPAAPYCRNMADEAGRRVLVTGGASGLGAALAEALRRRGDDVLVCDLAPTSSEHRRLDVTSDANWADVAQWVQREEWHPEQRLTPQPDGSLKMELPFVDQTELVMDLLRFGPDVKVVSPAGLRQAVMDRLTQAQAQYAKRA